ncbi:carboxynorspermidine decarboxylase [Anaerosporobacter faecicola]|uniref:carboxynorspermidine decarboxylase n=1 Tax=Anaerosporobacter faecicola TaxID=2718714 RepID=UPI00143BBD54|nr:carboxynorspermidine decarboxylase [Anaerosporobacter faecicola]
MDNVQDTISYEGVQIPVEQLREIPTPSYVVIEELLERNAKILSGVMERTGCKILLAQKAFSMFATYPLLAQYLSGTAASGLFEAKLGREEFGKEVHIYSPAYREEEMDEILQTSDHIVFNSFEQWITYKKKVQAVDRKVSCGLRINPEYSEVEVDLYNPCFPNSRFGVTLQRLEEELQKDPKALEGLEGFHFHVMCEQGAGVLERVLNRVESLFGVYLKQMKWVNFGGGHHITKPDYDLPLLEKLIVHVRDTYDVQVYMEPGEAIGVDTGILVTKVLDVMKNGMEIALLDTSAACHMPDVLEMPYRPAVIGAKVAGELPYTYRLSSATCLSGDVIGDYSFDKPLQKGELLFFEDMSHYTMVKNNTFNGINLPTIILYTKEQKMKVIRSFGYTDFKNRLS